MKVSELTGAQLDYWVARAMGYQDPRLVPVEPPVTPHDSESIPQREKRWSPSTDWTQGGRIIEREGISVEQTTTWEHGPCWGASLRHMRGKLHDKQLLVAAMRVYVASKFGNYILDWTENFA